MHRQTIDAYDAGADHWLRTRYRAASPQFSAAQQFREVVGPGVILDLGCGPAELLADLGHPSVGLDASSGMLALARDLDRRPLIQADIEVLPIADVSVAGAFANFSLQHLSRPSFRAAVSDIRRVLAPGGHLELTMHRGDHADGVRSSDDMPLGRWFTYWKDDEIVEVLDGEGFEVVVIEDLGFANRVLARLP